MGAGNVRLGLCEICGNDEVQVKKVMFEGSEVYACDSCTSDMDLKPPTPKRKKPRRRRKKRRSRRGLPFVEDRVLVDDYGNVVRRARERRELTQEELAGRLKEKASTIRNVENDELVPSEDLAEKLERFLGVKLYVEDGEGTNAALR